MNYKVLVVEDDKAISDLIILHLKKNRPILKSYV